MRLLYLNRSIGAFFIKTRGEAIPVPGPWVTPWGTYLVGYVALAAQTDSGLFRNPL